MNRPVSSNVYPASDSAHMNPPSNDGEEDPPSDPDSGSGEYDPENPPCFSTAAYRQKAKVWGIMKPTENKSSFKRYIKQLRGWGVMKRALCRLRITYPFPPDAKVFFIENLGYYRKPTIARRRRNLIEEIIELKLKLKDVREENRDVCAKLGLPIMPLTAEDYYIKPQPREPTPPPTPKVVEIVSEDEGQEEEQKVRKPKKPEKMKKKKKTHYELMNLNQAAAKRNKGENKSRSRDRYKGKGYY